MDVVVARTHDSDLRSLSRPGLYRTFSPLDPNERLPRELLLEDERSRPFGIRLGRQHVAGLLWLPVVLITLAAGLRSGIGALPALAAIALMLGCFWVFAFRRRAGG
jgi:hypothetical protein